MFELYSGLPLFDQMLHGVHVMLCAFAVLIACVPLFTEKGGDRHKFGGKIYVPVSCAAFTLATFMAWREASLVLLCFNAFCVYLLLSGWRAVHEKEKPAAIDWIIPTGLFLLAAGIAIHAVMYDEGKRSFYLMFFACNGFHLAVRDWLHLRRRVRWIKHRVFFAGQYFGDAVPSDWLNRHIAGMVGSMVANLSVVVLTLLPLELHWIWPVTLVLAAGGIALRQYHKKRQVQQAVPAVFQPKFRPGIIRLRHEDEDIRKAA